MLYIIEVPRRHWEARNAAPALRAIRHAPQGAEVRVCFGGIDTDPREIWDFDEIRDWCRAFMHDRARFRVPLDPSGPMPGRADFAAIAREPFYKLSDVAPELVSEATPGETLVTVTLRRRDDGGANFAIVPIASPSGEA